MSNRNHTITVLATGDLDESQDLLDAYIAGIKIGGMIFHSSTLEPEGPEAVGPVSLNAGENNNVDITIPNYTPEEGITYYLQYSDDDWDTFNPISDNAGPNEVFPYTYNGTRKFRVRAEGNGFATPGPSAGPIP